MVDLTSEEEEALTTWEGALHGRDKLPDDDDADDDDDDDDG
jgi:hypothetical protein